MGLQRPALGAAGRSERPGHQASGGWGCRRGAKASHAAREDQPAWAPPPPPPSLRRPTATQSSLLLLPLCRPALAYPTHVPLSGLEKGAVALLSLWGAFRNPWRGDLVASAGETTGACGLLS